MSEEYAISFQNVTKTYSFAHVATVGVKNFLLHLPTHVRTMREREPFRALDGVSFDVRRGECLGIIGRNGAGKSTALALMAGVLRPTEGIVETHGHVAPLLELGAGFHAELSGRENVVLNGILLGMTRDQVMERMDEIIAFSELGDFIDRPIRVYSSGMVVRLGFSVAVHLDPEILLIDEVLAVGDEVFQTKCLKKMDEFRASGVTMVFVSHDLKDIERVSDRVALLSGGRLVEVGQPSEVVSRYKEHARMC